MCREKRDLVVGIALAMPSRTTTLRALPSLYIARSSCALVVALLCDFPDLRRRVRLLVEVLLARAPLRRVPRLHARAVQLVYLLQTETLGLGDEEVHIDEAEGEHAEEDEEDKRSDLLRDARGEEREEEVPEPVCGCVVSTLPL